MAIYNTPADAANTAVRAFLTKVGESYLGSRFNTSQGSGRDAWDRIKAEVFGGRCAYCFAPTPRPTIEHLIMFNRADYGLHHPGNCVPACSPCNSSRKMTGGRYPTWEEHLRDVCQRLGAPDSFDARREKILRHHTAGEFAYPGLNTNESQAIRVIAMTLYKNIQAEVDRCHSLYEELDRVFVANLDGDGGPEPGNRGERGAP